MYNDYKQAFTNGLEYFKGNDNVHARSCFEKSVKDINYKGESLAKLVQIEIKEGKYAKARQILNENKDIRDEILKQVYGLLENVENNFEQSKKYYSECMVNPTFQYKTLLSIAKLNIQTGDYEVARKMLETLKRNPYFYVQSIFGLILINILECNLLEAKQLINTIDASRLSPKTLQHYIIVDMYIKYFLGELKMSDNRFDPVKDYMMYRLFDKSEELLINHIKKHCNQSQRQINGCFFKYTDIKGLLKDARDKIEDMNANHFEFSDMYRFRLDTPIGYKEDIITSDLCVTTVIGTKDIIIMYPITLSDEFDKEGHSTNKELKYKRLQGGICR